jgi:DNA-binding MarR family transcriptional regulator
METNLALKLLRILRRNAKGEPLTDAELRKLTRMDQMDIDIAAAQLEAKGMITIERTYTLVEE